jgi:tetratricopeptide (TPR) repeat protein
MSEGYGSRIYVKRRRQLNPWPYIIILLILVSSWFFFSSLVKDKSPLETLPPETKEDMKSNSAPTQAIKEAEPVQPKMPSLEESPGSVNNNNDRNRYNDTAIKPLPEPSVQTVEAPPAHRLIKAYKHYMNRQYREALKLYKELSDSNELALLYTGLCYYWLEDYQNAYLYLEKALDNSIHPFLARKFIAFTCYKMDELEESLTHAEEGLAIKSDRELHALRSKLIREKRVMKGYGSKRRPNFKILFSKFEHEEIKETVVDILKEAFRMIGIRINFYPSRPITVILYNEKGFFDVTRAPGWAGGLYDGKIRIPVKGVKGKETMLKRILFHEYTHALVHAITPRCPIWLNEGLAEYFSRGENEKTIGQLIPLKYLEKTFPSGNPRLVAAAYIESYSVVRYLIEKHKLFRVKALLESLGKGNDLNTAFNSVFYTSYDQFVKSWGKE